MVQFIEVVISVRTDWLAFLLLVQRGSAFCTVGAASQHCVSSLPVFPDGSLLHHSNTHLLLQRPGVSRSVGLVSFVLFSNFVCSHHYPHHHHRHHCLIIIILTAPTTIVILLLTATTTTITISSSTSPSSHHHRQHHHWYYQQHQ